MRLRGSILFLQQFSDLFRGHEDILALLLKNYCFSFNNTERYAKTLSKAVLDAEGPKGWYKLVSKCSERTAKTNLVATLRHIVPPLPQ